MLSVLPLLFLPLVAAQHNHGNGMDMSMDGPMDLAAGQMIPYFHFTPGDILWFQGWVPKSAKAMVGACLALFLFGIFERWLACLRAVAEQFWRKQAEIARVNKLNRTNAKLPTSTSCCSPSEPASASDISKITYASSLANMPPFIFEYDTARGVIHVLQMALQFAFMLAAM
ncbi:hypothetical protein NLI96_g6418 [Meripilus lineatus]|uniref:Copper transport protein n=1 Tax=Meripilus lineatus TaxID=2056292 RepID=A0AAD5V0W9_9APHY|nr:hypothetical protein NLI96_g6418 [Physisporinus lineatus]